MIVGGLCLLVAALNRAERPGTDARSLRVWSRRPRNVLGLIPLPRVARIYQRMRGNGRPVQRSLDRGAGSEGRAGDLPARNRRPGAPVRTSRRRGALRSDRRRVPWEERRQSGALGSTARRIPPRRATGRPTCAGGAAATVPSSRNLGHLSPITGAAVHLGHHQHVLDLVEDMPRLLSTSTTNDPSQGSISTGAIALACTCTDGWGIWHQLRTDSRVVSPRRRGRPIRRPR